MFKKIIVAAAIATTAFGASASVDLAGDAFQIYGQAVAYTKLIDDKNESDTSVKVAIESRIGFRGNVNFESFSPNLIWQIESGDSNNGPKSGTTRCA